jgi:hypothetical protein
MDISKYGPFANVVAIASALVATFSILLLKMLGRVKKWTWLMSGTPSFLVTAAARMLAVALIAVTYVIIDKSTYLWFGGAAISAGILGFAAVVRFDRLRKLHIATIPLVGPDGKPVTDKKHRALEQNVVIGLENDLRPEAKAALAEARKSKGGLSVRQFMSGYGAQRVNDPEALWDTALLVDINSRLTTTLMGIILLSVMTLFWAAFTIEAAGK